MIASIIRASEIAGLLAGRVDQLVDNLLPAGHREGHEWRCGSVAGEPGGSLGVHLTGPKAGVWADFSTGQKGDGLDLVAAVLQLDMHEALIWSRRWLGVEDKGAAPRSAPPARSAEVEHRRPDRWRCPWTAARPIAGTMAATYLAARGLHFDDPNGTTLRFASRRARKNPDDVIEHPPALLALLSDVRTGEACGIINVYLRQDGTDRLRDSKAKTNTGRAKDAAVMLSGFADVTIGLTVCEGPETAIGLLMHHLAPVWALGGAGNLASFSVLGGIETLTIAADADEPGRRAAATLAGRWRETGRQAAIITPAAGDWAAPRSRA